MQFSRRTLSLALVLLAAIAPGHVLAHPVETGMAAAADAWLASLTSAQKAVAVFDLKDDERHNWHFIPRERKSIWRTRC
jgi:hypothetical protein